MGITRELGERVQNWTYNKLDEAERIAAMINKKLNN
jgi:mitochondrial fission protein ELM1